MNVLDFVFREREQRNKERGSVVEREKGEKMKRKTDYAYL